MKRVLSILLCFIMLISMSSIAFAGNFEDVNQNYGQYEAIETLQTLNIINGLDTKTFGPEEILTRAQLCTMLVRAIYGEDTHYSQNIFEDVPLNHWARSAIDTAFQNELMIGYGNNKFGPEDKLTYIQTARTILNALGYGDLAWPNGVVAVAYELGLFKNINSISLEDGCTRAHASQMIYNAFELELVKEHAGQHFGINEFFLNDQLGFEKTTEYIDGHFYIAYKNLTDKDADLFITNIRSTDEKTIYPYSENEYTLTDSKKAKVYSFNWKNVDLFVNGYEVKDRDWFINAETATGTFDEDENLIAVYVINEGESWVPATGKGCLDIPRDILEEAEEHKNFDERTSVITYFIEDDSFIISNNIVCGFVEKRPTLKSIWINGAKYTFEKTHNYEKDDFVVIYFDYNEKIIDHTELDIEKIYHYDTEDMKLHTWDCEYYNDYSDDDYWMTYSEVNCAIDLLEEDEDILYFEACKHCLAENASRKFLNIVPSEDNTIYITSDSWYHYHTLECPEIKTITDTSIYYPVDIENSDKTACNLCCK